MSMPNFIPMKYDMPMICGKTYGQIQDDLIKDGCETVSDVDIYWYESDMLLQAEELAEKMNSTLVFHKVEVNDGHYVSFQFYVNEIYSGKFDLDKHSPHCIDNEDAHYYFDMCRSKALLAAEAEKRKIRKWLNGLTMYGFNKVVCTEIYSNGEAVYRVVA